MPAKRPLSFCYEYPRPAVTADAVVWTIGDAGWRILLIERKSEPFAGCWALPGGFINPDEPPLQACIRELREETNVAAMDFYDVGAFGEKGRDPRGWTISIAYYTLQKEGELVAKAGDDASSAAWHRMDELPALAFDHDRIIAKAKERLVVDLTTSKILAPLLKKRFSNGELSILLDHFESVIPQISMLVKVRLFASNLIKSTSKGWTYDVKSPPKRQTRR